MGTGVHPDTIKPGKGTENLWGKGVKAMKKESTQLHDLNTFEPLDADSLTDHDKKNSISSLMFLMEKRDGSIKARACADGRN